MSLKKSEFCLTCEQNCFSGEVDLSHAVVVVVAGQRQEAVLDLFRNWADLVVHLCGAFRALKKKRNKKNQMPACSFYVC